MKYQTPELTALTPAINAIQSVAPAKGIPGTEDAIFPHEEAVSGYADWE
jgi:hypothetical protein